MICIKSERNVLQHAQNPSTLSPSTNLLGSSCMVQRNGHFTPHSRIWSLHTTFQDMVTSHHILTNTFKTIHTWSKLKRRCPVCNLCTEHNSCKQHEMVGTASCNRTRLSLLWWFYSCKLWTKQAVYSCKLWLDRSCCLQQDIVTGSCCLQL